MLSALRAASSTRMLASSAFAQRRAIGDMARLTLIGRLAKDSEIRKTKSDKDFISYTVAVTNPPLPPNEHGERPPTTATFHRVLSFRPSANEFLADLKKGSLVYVEAALEIRDPDPEADPTTPQGQRQIFLKHQTLRVLQRPKPTPESEEGEATMSSDSFDHTSGF